MGYINDDEINEIRSRADIVDIISNYLHVTPKGKNHVAVCPFHDDHSPSLIISRERQIFNCFTCRTGGNVFTFVMKYENVGFLEAIKIVADKIGYNLNDKLMITPLDEKNQKDYEVYDFASKYYENNIKTSIGINARKYLNERGITPNIIKEFHIGLSSNSLDEFYKLTTSKNWHIEDLDRLGLINRVGNKIYDTFINRIMIPIEDLNGKVVGFTGRIYNGEDNTAKYLNTKETNIFKKSNILFNYHNAKNYIRDKKSVIVVEGNMDAIKLSALNIKNVVALMGVALSKEQITILKRLKVPVILMLDNDNAGLDATVKNGNLLMENDIETLVVRLSDAKDPDEYVEKFGIERLKDNIKHAIRYIDFKLEYLKHDKNLNNMEDIIKYVKEVLLSIKSQDDLTKEIILSKISKDYAIDIEVLKNNIKEETKKEEKNIHQKEKVERKITRYQKASHKVLYYMLVDKKYILLFKRKLGYFKEKIERILASEIIYYMNINDSINIADFTTYIMKNEEVYDFLQIIISENNNTKIEEKEFTAYIDAILKIYKEEEKNELKKKILSEMDSSKKEDLLKKFTNIKKEV